MVAVGPLTNVALATRLDPGLPGKYKRLVVMGGAVNALGNSWERAAEFNFYCDPEAAAVVLNRWPRLTLIPWETCLAHGLSISQAKELAAGDTPRAELFRRTLKNRFIEGAEGAEMLSMADPLAMAVAIDPGIVEKSRSRYIEIELAGQMTRGQTVVDWYDLKGKAENVEIIDEINRDRFWELTKRGILS
jgi:purine nucleosidase